MPPVLGLREVMKNEINKPLLLLMAVRRGDEPGFCQEDYEKLVKAGVSMEKIEEAVRDMKAAYPGSELSNEERKVRFANHYNLFLTLGSEIAAIPDETIQTLDKAGIFGLLRGKLFAETTV